MQPATPDDASELADMVALVIGCPPNGYLGQPEGVELKRILQTPMAAGVANDVIEKIRSDVPLARRLGPGGINLYAYDAAMDKKVIVIEVAGRLVPIGGGQ